MGSKPNPGSIAGLAEMMEACRVNHLNAVGIIKESHDALLALKDFANVLREACGPSMPSARPEDVPGIADLLAPEMEDAAWLDMRVKIMRSRNCLARMYAYGNLVGALRAKIDECAARVAKLAERIKGDSGAEAMVAAKLKGKLSRIMDVLCKRRVMAVRWLMEERRLVLRAAISQTVSVAASGVDGETLAMWARHYDMARQVELLNEENGKMLKGGRNK